MTDPWKVLREKVDEIAWLATYAHVLVKQEDGARLTDTLRELAEKVDSALRYISEMEEDIDG